MALYIYRIYFLYIYYINIYLALSIEIKTTTGNDVRIHYE